jgi:hypothetical protein
VNNWGRLVRWDFLACYEPQKLGAKLKQAAVGAKH